MFANQATLDSHTDFNLCASSVLDCINSNIDSVTTIKRITTFPSQKPWKNQEVRLLLKVRDSAFRSGIAHLGHQKGQAQRQAKNQGTLQEQLACGKASRPSKTINEPPPPLHPATPPYLISSTTSMDTLTGTTRRWPSNLCSLPTTSPSHSLPPTCIPH